MALALAALLAAQSALGSNARTAANERHAHTAAARMMAALNLPPGAIPTRVDPLGSALLSRPPAAPATPTLVDRHAFWRVPGRPSAVLAWIEAHPPAGSKHDMSGASARPGGVTATWDGYGFGPLAGILSYRELTVEVAQATSGGTALRADAEVVWVVVRSSAERVPDSVKTIGITSHRLGKPPSATYTVTSSVQVHKIVAFVNRLPLAQPGVRACPADLGPLVQLDFRGAASATPIAIATADGSGCGLVTLRLRGRTEPPLTGGPHLIAWLESVLGMDLG